MSSDMGIGGHFREIGGHFKEIGKTIAKGVQDAGKEIMNDIDKSLPDRASVEKFMGLDTVTRDHEFERLKQFEWSGVSRMSDKTAVRQIGKDIGTITSSILKNTWKAIKEEAKSSWKETKADLKETGKVIKEGAESVIEKGKGLVEKKKPGGSIRGSFRRHV